LQDQAFAIHAAMNIHLETLYGENAHHIAEPAFKGLARATTIGSFGALAP
jgi:imidazoleglycerol-phosphate dehydratase